MGPPNALTLEPGASSSPLLSLGLLSRPVPPLLPFVLFSYPVPSHQQPSLVYSRKFLTVFGCGRGDLEVVVAVGKDIRLITVTRERTKKKTEKGKRQKAT